jgi:hypothetical protein
MAVYQKLIATNQQFVGLSSDTKPSNIDTASNVSPGDLFYETDTQRTFKWSGSAWNRYTDSTISFGYQASTLSYIPLQLDGSGNLMTTGSGGAGGLADIQVRSSGNVWTDVGYSGGNLAAPVSVALSTYTALSGTVSSAGANTVVTPAAGKTARLYYLALSASATNATDVTVNVTFTSSVTPMYTVNLVPGAIYARNVGAGKNYLSGAVNDSIILNLSSLATVNWSIEHDEV